MIGRKLNENVIVNVIIDLKGTKYEYLFNLKLDKKNSIGKEFKDFVRLKNHKIPSIYYLYLSRNQNIIKELDKNEQLSKSDIKTGDKVIISDKIIKINSKEKTIKLSKFDNLETNNEFVYSPKLYNKKKRNIKNKQIKKFTKKFWIILALISIFILLTIGALLYHFVFSKKKTPPENPPVLLEKEDLIVNINYPIDILFKYENNKLIKMKSEKKTKNDTSSKEQLLNADVFFIIRKHSVENDNLTNITRNLFSGYLGIFNMIIKNETNDIQIMHDKQVDQIINLLSKNKNEKKPNLSYIEEEKNNLCFVKIEFYENGEIINITYPSNFFSLSNMQYIKDYAKLIIPKISSKLYNEDIENKLNNLLNNETVNGENKELKELNNNKDKIIEKKIRRISSNDSLEDFEIEDYLTPTDNQPLNIELREKMNFTNENEQNLHEISMNNINNDKVDIDGGTLNKSIYRTINNDGILESIIEYENIILKSDNDSELSDDIDENDSTYDINEDHENEFNYSDVDSNFINIESLSFDTINKIILKYRTSNDEIIKILYKYFDGFQYELFNETYYNDYINSQIINVLIEKNNITRDDNNISYKKEIINDNSYNNKLRRNSENSFYGMKKIINKKDLYSYNLVGMVMKNEIVNELDPSTGISQSYSVMTFGNMNKVTKGPTVYSNLHIILEKKNQMIFHLMKLVNQTNYDLKERNKNFTNIIINLENNLLELLNDIDYSNLFREHLDNIVEQLNNINGNIFDELIKLINNVYNNYSIILQDVKNEKYDIFEIIRNLSKNEYMEYIYNMLNIF